MVMLLFICIAIIHLINFNQKVHLSISMCTYCAWSYSLASCCCSCSRYALILLFKPCALLHKCFTPIASVLLSKSFNASVQQFITWAQITCHMSLNSNHWMIVNIVSYLKCVSAHYWILFFELFFFISLFIIYSTRSIAPDGKTEQLVTFIGSESNTFLTLQSGFLHDVFVIITSLLLSH